jgi:hypothetical protein
MAVTTGTIIDSVKDAISVSKNIIESAERDRVACTRTYVGDGCAIQH